MEEAIAGSDLSSKVRYSRYLRKVRQVQCDHATQSGFVKYITWKLESHFSRVGPSFQDRHPKEGNAPCEIRCYFNCSGFNALRQWLPYPASCTIIVRSLAPPYRHDMSMDSWNSSRLIHLPLNPALAQPITST